MRNLDLHFNPARRGEITRAISGGSTFVRGGKFIDISGYKIDPSEYLWMSGKPDDYIKARSEKSLGQIGYEAYGESVGWVTYLGAAMPEWHQLTDAVRGGWEAAVTAILGRE